MRVTVGSKNPAKIAAVTETISEYPLFQGAEVAGLEVAVDLFGHPKSLNEVVDGAIARARQAFADCDYSFGIEGGLMAVPETKTGFMEVSACAVYDGRNIHLGLSPAFEWPKKVTGLILDGLDGSQALKEAGMTEHPKIGTGEGGVSILTDGRMDRKAYTKAAIMMALIHLEHPEHF